jgi:lysozyme family protein
MPNTYSEDLAKTLKSEGDTVDNTLPGTTSLYGIVQPTYDSWLSRKGLPSKPVTTITLPEAKQIYFEDFYKGPGIDILPKEVQGVVFDYGVNVRPRSAIKALQEVIGAKVDGWIGPETRAKSEEYIKLNGVDNLKTGVLDKRQAYYDHIIKVNPDRNKKFEKGWKARVDSQRPRSK